MRNIGTWGFFFLNFQNSGQILWEFQWILKDILQLKWKITNPPGQTKFWELWNFSQGVVMVILSFTGCFPVLKSEQVKNRKKTSYPHWLSPKTYPEEHLTVKQQNKSLEILTGPYVLEHYQVSNQETFLQSGITRNKKNHWQNQR